MRLLQFSKLVTFGPLCAGTCLLMAGCAEPEASEYREIGLKEIEELEVAERAIDALEVSQTKEVTSTISISNTDGTSLTVTESHESPTEGSVYADSAPDSESKTTASGGSPIISSAKLLSLAPASRAGNQAVGRKVKVLVKHRKFRVEGPQSALRVTYDDFNLLKVLNMDPVTMDAPKLMPKWLRDLDGKRIRVRGFMYPTMLESGLRGFVLTRDTDTCCFGPNAKPYDWVEVTMREGVTADFILRRPFDVVGVFHIDPIELDGVVRVVYQIDDAIVIEK